MAKLALKGSNNIASNTRSNSSTNIVSYFRRFFIPPKDSSGNYVNGPQTKLYPFSIGALLNIFPSLDTQQAVDLGFAGNATVYSIVRDSGKKFGSIPRYLTVDPLTSANQKALDKLLVRRKTLTIHSRTKANAPYADQIPNMNDKRIAALSKLLNHPNEYQGQDAFFDTLMESYLITGEAFIWLNRGFKVNESFQYIDDSGRVLSDEELDQMPVLEMFWMPSNYMTHLPDLYDPFAVAGWVLIYFGFQIFLRKQDIILWKTSSLLFDPITRPHLRGVSPLKAGGAILQANSAAILSTTRIFQNNGAFGMITYDDTTVPAAPGEMDELRSVIEKKVSSGDYGGAIAAVAGKWEYTNFGRPETLPLIDGMRYSDQQLCMLFQYPYELINPNTTFNNKQMAQKSWINNSIIPACKQLDDEMNRCLLKAFGLRGVVCITSDYHMMPELQDDMNSLTQSFSQAWWFTGNEKRIAYGYDPLPDPMMDEIMIPTGVTPSSSMKEDDNLPISSDYTDDPDDDNDFDEEDNPIVT